MQKNIRKWLGSSLLCLIVAGTGALPLSAQVQAPAPSPLLEAEAPESIAPKLSKLNRELLYRVTVGRAADVKLLLSQGADANVVNESNWSALALASSRTDEQSLPIVKTLVEHGAELTPAGNGRAYPPLIAAIENGNASVVWYLLHEGASFLVTNAAGFPAVDVARQIGNPAVTTLVEEAIRIEEERASKERSPENKARLVKLYSFYSCSSTSFNRLLYTFSWWVYHSNKSNNSAWSSKSMAFSNLCRS